ncbi:MAG: Gfo/Idh/MocA family protein [Sedimentisphaeraceae bacterium JB056]
MSEIIKIGCVDIDTSHPLVFAKRLAELGRGKYVGVFNDGFRGDDEVDSFVKAFGIEKKCGSIEELASICDIGFVHSCNWDKHLNKAVPFIEAGVPVFVDKPIVGSFEDCRRLKGLVASGAVILGSSSMRYASEVQKFNSMPADEKGDILHIYGTVGVDEFNYAIHIVEAICQIAGGGSVWGKFNNSQKQGGVEASNYSLGFDNGVTASYTVTSGVWQPCVVVVMTTKGVFHFEIDSSKVYDSLLTNIYDHIQKGTSDIVSVDKLLESIEVMLACRQSLLTDGKRVETEHLDEDISYDGDAFEQQYASNAAKIYI